MYAYTQVLFKYIYISLKYIKYILHINIIIYHIYTYIQIYVYAYIYLNAPVQYVPRSEKIEKASL